VKRREFLFAVAGLSLCIIPPSDAQLPSRVYRIGYFLTRGPDAKLDDVFVQSLNELGYHEGKNLLIERRFGHNKAETFPGLAAELATMHLDVIVVAPNSAATAMKQAAPTTPIVMMTGADPVANGLIASLARPGGNVTGLSNVSTEIIGKEMQLLKKTVPGLSRVAFLANAQSLFKDVQFSEARAAAQALHVELVFVQAEDAADFERAFAAMSQARANGLVIALEALMFGERKRLAELASKHRLPAISAFREFADVGGLMAYGANLADMYRRSATYVDKILKGANPAELPVEQPLKFDMLVNLKTAKALGLTVPQSILIRADEVIR
jgi:putative ABC transport system substrate-binding protein